MEHSDFLARRLELARMWTNNLLSDIEPRRFYEPPAPGTGHAAWQMGHLAASQVALVHMRCFDRNFTELLPAEWRGLFARGSTPTPGPVGYPTLDEIREAFDRVQRETLALIRGTSAAELAKPAGSEPHPLFTDKQGAIATATIHETFHAGQIALIRRIQGKQPIR